MPEVHFLGEILGGHGFDKVDLFCQWKIMSDAKSNWQVIRGQEDGQTQIDAGVEPTTLKGYEDLDVVWSHPFDIQYTSSSLIGWPKIYVEVWHHDSYDRNIFVGYGFCHIPSSHGTHNLDIVVWQPQGNWTERLAQTFLGSVPQLEDSSIVHRCGNRFGLFTKTEGIVIVQISVLHSGFTQRGGVFETIDTSPSHSNESD